MMKLRYLYTYLGIQILWEFRYVLMGQNDLGKVLRIWGPKGPISVMEVGSSTMQLH